MIWGGINAVEPPYTILVTGLSKAPPEVATEVEHVRSYLAEHRNHFQAQKGRDIEVKIETAPDVSQH